MSDWQNGYDIEYLRRLAAPFKAHYKQHSYGAFGIPKERDVAAALAAGHLAVEEAASGQIGAVAIIKPCNSASKQHDFAGRDILLMKGDVQVKAIAGDPEHEERLMRRLVEAHGSASGAIWVEAHAERLETLALLHRLGFQRVATKITASSDLKAMMVWNADPSLRVSSPLDPADEATLKQISSSFASESEIEQIKKEMTAWGPDWQQHYSSYNKRSSWTAVAMKGFDPLDIGFIIKPSEMSKQWKAENPHRLDAPCVETAAAALVPTAMSIADRIPGRKERVRLMKVLPNGGELTRHADITDRDAGTRDDGIVRLHVPIVTHPDVKFSAWQTDGQKIAKHFPAGSLFYIDIRKPHTVRNDSPVERIHLVMDVHSNEEIRRWLRG